MNAIDRSATRSETLHRGINQGIDLGNIKGRMGSIQFKIGFHHQDCLHTILVYFKRRPDVFDIGIFNRHGVHSPLSARHTTEQRQKPARQPGLFSNGDPTGRRTSQLHPLVSEFDVERVPILDWPKAGNQRAIGWARWPNERQRSIRFDVPELFCFDHVIFQPFPKMAATDWGTGERNGQCRTQAVAEGPAFAA
jgi:hypothetical protein